MSTRRRYHTIHAEADFHRVEIVLEDFNVLIDNGYEDIMVLTVGGRFIASLDEWLDYGYVDIVDDVEVRVLHRSKMSRV